MANNYDKERRVTHQYATVGTDLRLIRNATFVYSNNFVFTNSVTNLIYGATLITDYLTNVTRYEYTNSLMTRTLDPLNRETRQVWYFAGDSSAGAYPGSLKTSIDRRGLITEYRYDSDGNATNVTTIGDFTGSGSTNETAVQLFAYNTNRLVTSIVDAVGNRTVFTYTNPISPFLRTSEERSASNGTQISVSVMDYYNVTNAVIVNNYKGALGLPRLSVRAHGTSDAATNQLGHDPRGFITNEVRYTGTADPTVSNAFFYNYRGEYEPHTPTKARGMPINLTLGQLLDYERFSKRSKAHLLPTEHPNTMPTSECCPGQRKSVVSRVCFNSARPVRFQSGMRLAQLCRSCLFHMPTASRKHSQPGPSAQVAVKSIVKG